MGSKFSQFWLQIKVLGHDFGRYGSTGDVGMQLTIATNGLQVEHRLIAIVLFAASVQLGYLSTCGTTSLESLR
jgi:hypothetical protein